MSDKEERKACKEKRGKVGSTKGVAEDNIETLEEKKIEEVRKTEES